MQVYEGLWAALPKLLCQLPSLRLGVEVQEMSNEFLLPVPLPVVGVEADSLVYVTVGITGEQQQQHQPSRSSATQTSHVFPKYWATLAELEWLPSPPHFCISTKALPQFLTIECLFAGNICRASYFLHWAPVTHWIHREVKECVPK